MSISFDEVVLTVTCPQCSQTVKEKARWFKDKNACPACSAILIEPEKIARLEQDLAAQIRGSLGEHTVRLNLRF